MQFRHNFKIKHKIVQQKGAHSDMFKIMKNIAMIMYAKKSY